ncbi:MAG: PP2C family protein-serine/threonine phosphatase [Phycisphaerae bacterium]|jgi:hypothetical protein
MEATVHKPAGESEREFWHAFDAERARVLRKRILWYAAVMMTLLGLAFLGGLIDVFFNPTYNDGSPRRAMGFEVASTGGGVLIFLVTYVLVRVRKPDRRRLVFIVSVIAVFAAILVTVLQSFVHVLDLPQSQGGSVPDDDPLHAPVMAVINSWFFQAMACLLIPMPLRESWRFSLLSLLAVPIATIFVIGTPLKGHIAWTGIGAVCMFLPMLWSAWRYREMDARFAARQRLAKFDEVASELAYARRIHEAIFPPPVTRGRVRVTYAYEPMREIGGDFLFVWPLHVPPSENDASLTAVLIDVSGHGVAAALAVNRFHGELRRFFATRPHGSPRELMEAMNAFAYEELAPQAVFATAIAVHIDVQAGVMEAANAGHPPAILRRGDGSVREIGATATMLGVLPPDAFSSDPWQEPFSADDRVVMYTDGLSETLGRGGELFGSERVAQAVASGESPERVAASAAQFRVGPARDDLLVVEVRGA